MLGQVKEIGISLGGVNPISDVGSEIFFLPRSYSVGIYYKKAIGERYIFRSDIFYHNLVADDKNSIYQVKRDREYSFNSNLFELSSGFDLTFWKYDYVNRDSHILYFIGELSLILASYKKPQFLGGEIIYNNKNLVTFGIPLGIGYRKRKGSFVISLEYKCVVTFNNNLDGRSINNIENKDNYNVNVYNTFDFYNYITLNFGIIFGREACTFCIDSFN